MALGCTWKFYFWAIEGTKKLRVKALDTMLKDIENIEKYIKDVGHVFNLKIK
jgi:hypothetical protein